MKQRILLVTKDKALADLIKKVCEKKRVQIQCVATPKESFSRWKEEESELAGESAL